MRVLLLGARLLSREVVEEEDRLPHLFFLQEFLPGGHRRVPGPPFLGKPGPPLAIRQKRNVSRNMAIAPWSAKLVGIGSRPCTNMPLPARLSPWQKTQFR